ncbi:ferrichrome-type siderophore transporter [Coprinopsis sp. MPI-PUGE-AT-0042]|nr:ferrichrome-type siderophore transporter [Coprinopsis sp. MPI-PUGE-AT-0042]
MSLFTSEYKVDAEKAKALTVDSREVEAHEGVRAIEATYKVFGKYSTWALFISLGLAAYIYSLDGTTTWAYLAFALSSFGGHSFISTVQVAQSIIIAVGKPVIAKVADVKSRPVAYVIVLVFYVIGYIVIASAKNAGTIGGGIVIYAVGYTGLQLLTQIIIADVTSLKWRGLVSGLISLPFVVNAFVGTNISASLNARGDWRWGYAMFAILVPATLLPLIVVLIWADRKAKKTGLLVRRPTTKTIPQRFTSTCSKLDVIGLFLLAASIALILLPLTLSRKLGKGWQSAAMIAPLVIGIVLIPVFVLYEWKVARYPIIPRRFVTNRSVVIAMSIGLFDFISFYLSYTYLYSFVFVVKPWSLINATYFSQSQTVALTIFGILGGVILRFTHRYKPVLVAGLAIRLLGAGLMIHSRGANASDAEVVWSQLLQGIGGGFAAVASQVGAQASVPHMDTASVTAIVLLVTEVGGAIGAAIAGAIWTSQMPDELAKNLPFLDEATRAKLFGSITAAATYPRGDPIREGVITAYDTVMFRLCLAATIFAIPPLVASLFMPNWYLGDQQNAVDATDLTGAPVVDEHANSTSSSHGEEDEKVARSS